MRVIIQTNTMHPVTTDGYLFVRLQEKHGLLQSSEVNVGSLQVLVRVPLEDFFVITKCKIFLGARIKSVALKKLYLRQNGRIGQSYDSQVSLGDYCEFAYVGLISSHRV